mmetsp:Transcript_12979/g.34968  ORF Transcript_12979/g.34968 Transcript_12979/m.34968 type:complete len:95 (-) Transcript_12979:285-569(-)
MSMCACSDAVNAHGTRISCDGKEERMQYDLKLSANLRGLTSGMLMILLKRLIARDSAALGRSHKLWLFKPSRASSVTISSLAQRGFSWLDRSEQ